MTTKWLFYAGGKKAGEDLTYACKVLGKHRDIIDSISDSLFKIRFSQKYSIQGKLNSEETKNSVFKNKEHFKFEPEEGLDLIEKIKIYLTVNKKLYRNTFDFDLVIIDLDEVKKLMQRAKKENQKWHLSIVS